MTETTEETEAPVETTDEAPVETLPAVVEQAEETISAARAVPARQGAVLPSPDEWAATMTVARTIARTSFVPKDYRGQPEAVVAAILMGRELGIGPMESLKSITMIDGRPTLSAALMLSKMRENGLVILASEVNQERAWIHAKRTDTGEEASIEWTYAEAEKIKRGTKMLVDGDGWKNYREDMLWARCVGRVARRLGSDLLAGNLYSTEEVRDFDDRGPGATTYEQANDGTSAYFDPGAQLLDGAIHGGDDVPRQIFEALVQVDPTVDWVATINTAIEGCFAVKDRKEIPAERGREFWIRLANAAAKADDGRTGDFPPVDPGKIDSAFRWAFGLDDFSITLKAEDAETEETTEATEGTTPEEVVEDAEVEELPEGDGSGIPVADVEFGEEAK